MSVFDGGKLSGQVLLFVCLRGFIAKRIHQFWIMKSGSSSGESLAVKTDQSVSMRNVPCKLRY